MADLSTYDQQYQNLQALLGNSQWDQTWVQWQMQQVVAQRDAAAATIASENDAWHKAHGTGIYATGGGSTFDPYADALNRQRESAYSTLYSMFKEWGIDMDGSGLAAQVKSWVFSDKSNDEIIMEFRKSDAYNKRFTGMADLIKRGQFMSEAEYIAQERAYRNVMVSWDLPKNFYDSYDDYGRFIANGVSVKELDDRIASAKTFLDSTDPNYRDALKNLYGVSDGGMLAYVLDGDKAQAVLQQQFKAATFSGSASQYDFNLTKDQAEMYGATLGDQFNRIGADQVNALKGQMASLDQVADNQESLSFIDNEAYTRTDTLDAEILSDSSKRAASERRALREKARFSGSSATNAGTLSRNSGV
jgi:hypothetical protein